MKTSKLTPLKNLEIAIKSIRKGDRKTRKPMSWIWSGSSLPILNKLDEAQILFLQVYEKPSKEIQKAKESVIEAMFNRFK